MEQQKRLKFMKLGREMMNGLPMKKMAMCIINSGTWIRLYQNMLIYITLMVS